MARKPMSRADTALRRAQIAAAARRCFAEHGYRGSTVEALERASGVTRGTLFKYFRGKAALLDFVLAAEAHRRRATFDALLESGDAPLNLVSALTRALLAQIARSRSDPQALRLRLEVLKLAEHDRRLAQRIRALEDDERHWRQSLVGQLARRGWLHPRWPLDAATDLVSTVWVGVAVQLSFGLSAWRDDAGHAAALAQALAAQLSQPPDDPGARRG